MQKGLLKKYIYSIWTKIHKDEVWRWQSFCQLKMAKVRVSEMRNSGWVGSRSYEKVSIWKLHSKTPSDMMTTYDLMRIGEELKV